MGLPRRKAPAGKIVTEQELTLRARRYARVSALFESPAWKEDLLPYLKVQLAAIGRDTTWRPSAGLPKLEAIALGCAYQGGKEDALLEIGAQLQSWHDEGKRAKEKLEKMAEKEDKP